MKIFILKKVVALTAIVLSTSTFAMDVKFNDAAWNAEAIPAGQQCLNYDGKNPATPSLNITNIPAGADSLVFVYNDVSNKRMQNGGHGIIGYALPVGTTNIDIPKVFGHTYELPVGFETIVEYRNRPNEVGGAYKPPCSGGKNHLYTVDVQAWQGDMILAETSIEMGRY